jgi:LysM repeat protein
MRWRVLLLVSACVNGVLLAAWLSARKPPASAPSRPEAASEPRSHTNVVVRRQFFMWSELESPDYVTYIANLRDIGCPEQTIRDIIIADVNGLFAKRRATELPTAEQQWWRAPTEVAAAASRKLKELEVERRALLARLLGPGWDAAAADASLKRKTGVTLEGDILGRLPEEVKAAINKVVALSQQRLEELAASTAQQGRRPTPAQLAKIRDQTRAELQVLLTPPQLEEFLLRYSQGANQLRAELGELKYFNASQDEFRALFRARDAFDQKLAALGESTDPNDMRQRQSLEQQREAAIKLALGAERYEQYNQLRDPNYRAAWAQANEAGAPSSARAIYEINKAAKEEQAQMRTDSTLTTQQLAIETKRVELEQAKAVAQAVGQEVPPDPNAPPPPPPPPQNRLHIFKAGDTLGALSTAYGVPVNAILNANPDLQINNLKPGQRIFIPPAPSQEQ